MPTLYIYLHSIDLVAELNGATYMRWPAIQLPRAYTKSNLLNECNSRFNGNSLFLSFANFSAGIRQYDAVLEMSNKRINSYAFLKWLQRAQCSLIHKSAIQLLRHIDQMLSHETNLLGLIIMKCALRTHQTLGRRMRPWFHGKICSNYILSIYLLYAQIY